MPTDCLEIPPEDPVGQIIYVQKTDKGCFGFLIARGGEKSRIFWHSDFCVEEAPELGDLIQFRIAPPRRANENPRAKEIRILAKAEKTKE